MMLKLILDREKDADLHVLCLGAHSDDIEIGCGGTILRLAEEFPQLCVDWVVFSATQERADEARKSAEQFLDGVGQKNIVVRDFRDGFFPYRGEEIKEFFEQLKRISSPELIFTHYRQDLHQDHRLISDLTWNTFRNQLILEYEIPKYDGDLGAMNCFSALSLATCQKKIQTLLSCFQTQRDNHWFTEDTFRATLRLRGIEAMSPSGYAEGFFSRKFVI